MPHPARLLLRLADDVEARPWNAGTLALLVAGVIVVRNVLEITVARNPVFEGLAAFVHYPLAYVGPFAALTLVLAAWSGVAPLRVARLMSLAWLLTLLPPAVDLLVHHGGAAPAIAYLLADPTELGRVWLRFFDPSVKLTGTTPGIRVETAAAVVLGATYVWLRARRPLRAAGAAVSIYFVSLFFFSLPLLVTVTFRRLGFRDATFDSVLRGEGVVFRPDRDSAPDSTATLWLILVLCVLGGLWHLVERRHAERLVPAGAPAPRRGILPLLVAALATGMIVATRLHLPYGTPLNVAAFDLLVFAAAPVVLVLLASAAADPRAPRAAWCAGLGLAGCAALGTAPALGLLAAAAAFLPAGLGLARGTMSRVTRLLAPAWAAVAAFAAGYCTIVGPEGLARMPLAAVAPSLAAGLALGVLALFDEPPVWLGVPVFGAALGLGVLLAGEPRLAVVAIPAGFVCGAIGWAAAGFRPAAARVLAGAALALSLFGVQRGMVAGGELRERWSRAATCVPRLEVARGERLEKTAPWSVAEGAYRKALDCDPNFVPALRALGLGVVRNEKRMTKGAEYLERALAAAPDSPVELANLGALYMQQQRSADAVKLLDRAVQIDPGNLQAHFNRAQALEDVGRRAEAADAWKAYIAGARGRPQEAESLALARQRLAALGGS